MTLGDLVDKENKMPEACITKDISNNEEEVVVKPRSRSFMNAKWAPKISQDLSCFNFHSKEAEGYFVRHLMERLSADCASLSAGSQIRNVFVKNESEKKVFETIVEDLKHNGLIDGNDDEENGVANYQRVTYQNHHLLAVTFPEVQKFLLFVFTESNDSIEGAAKWLKDNKEYVECLLAFFQYHEKKGEEESHETHTPMDNATQQQKEILEQITVLFENELLKRRVKKNADDFWEAFGKNHFKQSMWYYVENNQRILFALPAFPCKSSNTRTKVLGKLPDVGERLALQRLERFLISIKTVYPPGGHLVIFSDGRVYCDLFRIADDTTTKFITQLRKTHVTDKIAWSDLDMFFGKFDDVGKRHALVNIFGTTPENIYEQIKEDSDFREVYCGFQRFLLDEIPLPNGVRDKEGRRLITDTARRIMMRTFSYSNFMRILFPHHVRWSIHPSRCSTKFSINLVGRTDWGTPWHNCALLQPDGSWNLVRRKTAEEKGFKLSYTDDNLPYYINEADTPFIEKL